MKNPDLNWDWYSNWKLWILSKATGANVHEINGALGRFMNYGSLYAKSLNQGDSEKTEYYKEMAEDNLKQLGESPDVLQHFIGRSG